MAWDTKQTKSQLLNTAADEFAENGFAGTLIDHITKAAGVNKERICTYFGNKADLFEAVITCQPITGLDGVPLTGTGPEAVGRGRESRSHHHWHPFDNARLRGYIVARVQATGESMTSPVAIPVSDNTTYRSPPDS